MQIQIIRDSDFEFRFTLIELSFRLDFYLVYFGKKLLQRFMKSSIISEKSPLGCSRLDAEVTIVPDIFY